MLSPINDAGRGALRAHEQMRASGDVPSGGVPTVIASSWRRCLDSGLRWESPPDFEPLRHDSLCTHRERNAALIGHALPIMETLFQQIANTQSMVVLSDASGFILHSLGDDDFLARAQRVALAPGVDWSEQSKGTNAIGTALSEQTPVVVHAAQHFLPSNHFLTCSAAPILDPFGTVAGVLDVTGDRRRFSLHTLALARMSTQMIENQLFCDTFAEAFLVRFHARPEFLGTLYEGLAAFAGDGRLLAANRVGWFQFALEGAARCGQTFDTLFGLPFGAALGLLRNAAPSPSPLVLHNGIRVFLRLDSTAPQSSRPATQGTAAPRPADPAVFFAADAKLLDLRGQAARAVAHGIPLLVQGESGCGKSALVRWLRATRAECCAWVEIDCNGVAGEELDRLLGGCRGARPVPAALFLKDVDRLAPVLQARLVAALHDPLASGPLRAACTVIASSRENLPRLVAQRLFRDDLFHRLSGLEITLPPLRQRGDAWDLAEVLAARIGGDGAGLRLHEELRAVFTGHPWPGNVRQMIHVLRLAAAAAPDGLARTAHLPSGFLDCLDARVDAPDPAAGTADLDAMTRQAIDAALRAHGGNVSAAARRLGISRSTLYRRLSA